VPEDGSRTDLGLIRVHKNAIASIASIAALDIPGVKRIGRSLKGRIMEFIGYKGQTEVRVTINKKEEVRIDIPVFIKYGFNIPDIANRVQEDVRLALEKMTSLTIKDININVLGIERG